MLSFSVLDTVNVSGWCSELSSILKTHSAKAAVFITGKVAQQHPECVTVFGDNVDIGSQTYNYVNLTSISDYTLQLEEVRKGKQAVDNAGKLYSRLFKAPYGFTDDNIYSLLSRSDIVADFSYDRQYNIFCNGQFIKFDSITYNGSQHSAEFFLSLPKTTELVIIAFENTTPAERISELLSKLNMGYIQFVNASEIAGFNLTLRGG